MGAALVALWSTLGGALLTYLYDKRATVGARLCAGVALGMALLGFSGYTACAVRGRMDGATLVFALVVTGLPYLTLCKAGVRALLWQDLRKSVRLRPFTHRRFALWTVGALTIGLLYVLFRGTMYLDSDGNLWTNNHHNIGDLPFHVAVVQGFVQGNNFPPQHPEFSGARLTYPFLVDFVHALYIQAGATLTGAAFLQNMILGIALIGLFYRWTFTITRSLFAALVAPLLVLFSGGLGFVRILDDLHISHTMGVSLLELLKNLPQDYTLNDAVGLQWGNSVTTLLTTQRGLMLAIPMALIVLTLFWQEREFCRRATERSLAESQRAMKAAGLIAGGLPLIHGHTFLMLFLVGGGLALEDLWSALRRADRAAFFVRIRIWLLFFGTAIALAIPQAYVLAQASSVHSEKFVGWAPGWDHGDMPLLPFWLWNLGAFLPLLFAAVLWRRHGKSLLGRRLLLYYAPFVACFIVPNLIRLAPWIWDNMKILFYWHMASSVVVALLLAKVWRGRNLRIVRRPAVVVCLLVLTLAGLFDVSRIARGTLRQYSYDAESIAFARAIDAVTPPDAVLLHYPLYNHPATYAGRHLVMGYEGHLWSHGLDFGQRKLDVIQMYSGSAEAPDLFAKYGVQYVVVGPTEINDPLNTGVRANVAFFQQYPVAATLGQWKLYRVAGPVVPER